MLPADVPRDAVIVTRNLQRDYDMGGEVVHALRGVDLVIRKNEYVAIMGPSGSGKSTLMNLIGCLDSPTGGEYWLNGHRVSRAGRRRAGADPEQARSASCSRPSTCCPAPPRCTTSSCRWCTPALGARERRSWRPRRSRRVGPGRPHAAPAERAVGRPAPARGDRPGAGQPARASCWPTSRPATSTAAPARRSWGCSRRSIAKARPSCW